MQLKETIKLIFYPLVVIRRVYFKKKYSRLFRSNLVYDDREKFIKEQYKWVFGKYPNLTNPQTFNEKIQWLKLNWYSPLAQKCADKYAVREYISERIGEKYLNPIYGIWDSPEEIKFEDLPDKFVLKSTHASGHVVICRNKSKFNWKRVRNIMAKWLLIDYYELSGEWVYKDIPRRIICEKLIETEDGKAPKDYKFFCFNGVPKYVQIDIDRFEVHKRIFYNDNWVKQPFGLHYQLAVDEIPCPDNFNKMLLIAKKLSDGFTFVRVDLYSVGSDIIFGELTFFPGNGLEKFAPLNYDVILGTSLTLPKINPVTKF